MISLIFIYSNVVILEVVLVVALLLLVLLPTAIISLTLELVGYIKMTSRYARVKVVLMLGTSLTLVHVSSTQTRGIIYPSKN